jgi:hypothetical protein
VGLRRQLLTTPDGWYAIALVAFVVGSITYTIVRFWP